jgi:hypothetical protein
MLHLYLIKKESSPLRCDRLELDHYKKSHDSVLLLFLQHRPQGMVCILSLLFSETAVKVGRRGENKLGVVFPVFVFRVGIPMLLAPVTYSAEWR